MMLHAAGLRFCLYVKDLPGRPDIVLPKWKTVVFVYDCSLSIRFGSVKY